MAIDPRRRQRQLARKAAKRKAQLEGKRQKAERHSSWLDAMAMAQAATYPIYESLIPKALFKVGLGNIVVSRRSGNTVAAGVFLVDAFCLGVKDGFFAILSIEEYRTRLEQIRAEEELIPVQPTCARKLIEGAVSYAQDLGFSPHKDYERAKVIFGDIDPNTCPTSFEFGKDNKPFFFAGPHETPARCQQILNILTKRCGADGFHYLIGMQADN